MTIYLFDERFTMQNKGIDLYCEVNGYMGKNSNGETHICSMLTLRKSGKNRGCGYPFKCRYQIELPEKPKDIA